MQMTDLNAHEKKLAHAAAVELSQVLQPMIVELSALDAYYLVGMLQLALGHPHLPLNTRHCALGLVATFSLWFEAMGCTGVVDQINHTQSKIPS